MHVAALINKGISDNTVLVTAQQILRMATIKDAKVLGLVKGDWLPRSWQAGRFDITECKKPQFYPNPVISITLSFSAQSADIITFLVEGKVLMDDF